ncbi:MAG TPA: hypothetical protein HA254_00965 [Candidatus Diapherotrites archaeon]|uniref:Uncharacterized protein n=1 Tax=Candidatus Iainarchaeum sp. TaxID=3101447 RepID=A0A7J4IWJ5_9ARCH|nr:hypothetical protein [Candidatus Diapherotrites archaeon]
MPARNPLGKFYLDLMPKDQGWKLGSAIRRMGVEDKLTPSAALNAWDIHKSAGVPLRMAIESQLQPATRNPLSSEVIRETAKNLHSSFQLVTKGGRARVSVSLQGRTITDQKKGSYKVNGLHHFTALAFRVMPASSEIKRFDPKLHNWLRNADALNSMFIVEVGFAKIGKKPVLVVTNAQATRQFYSLAPSQKKMFKESYPAILKGVQKASGNLPLLIPTNKAVQEMLQALFGHSVSDKVLDEFYDGFSAKRGRRRASLEIKNALDGRKFKAEFWVK